MNRKRTGIGTSVIDGIRHPSANRTNAIVGCSRKSTAPTYMLRKLNQIKGTARHSRHVAALPTLWLPRNSSESSSKLYLLSHALGPPATLCTFPLSCRFLCRHCYRYADEDAARLSRLHRKCFVCVHRSHSNCMETEKFRLIK